MECLAVAYDTPIPGYATKNCANIRLWSAKVRHSVSITASMLTT
jgi:glucan phosphorylase